MDETKKNAIERRIEELEVLWNEFADNPEARILRWLVDNDSTRMVDLFLELQNEEVSEIPDLFIRFNEPFEDPQSHGFVLRESLIGKYEDVREALAKEDIPASWACPAIETEDPGTVAFVKSCASLHAYSEDTLEHLVAVLAPINVTNGPQWQQWLQELLESGPPLNIRFLVVDNKDTPLLNDFCEANPGRVMSNELDLDMPGAYVELARDVPGTGPGFDFRRLFVALNNAAGSGDVDTARQAADRALKIATEQKWPQMQVAALMALGAAYMGVGKTAETLQCYRSANQAAAQAIPDDPVAPKLVIQTRFAEAAVLVGEGQNAEAAAIYEEIVPVAENQEDHFALLESWRMAAYCHEMGGEREAAWTCGHKALEAGALMDDENRAASTLPYVGQGLLRLTEEGPYAENGEGIRERMTALIGQDWEEKIVQGAPAS